jgi:hypothetical protein
MTILKDIARLNITDLLIAILVFLGFRTESHVDSIERRIEAIETKLQIDTVPHSDSIKLFFGTATAVPSIKEGLKGGMTRRRSKRKRVRRRGRVYDLHEDGNTVSSLHGKSENTPKRKN